MILIGDLFCRAMALLFLCRNLIGSVPVWQTVHIEQGTRSHRNRQAVHIETGKLFTSTPGTRSHRLDVNEMVAQIVNIENETETLINDCSEIGVIERC